MPVHRVPGGWRWGATGKVYRTKAEAERQAVAIYASGYREDARSRALVHRALSASKRAESRYVLDLQAIMRRTHATVMREVEANAHTDSLRLDALDSRFLRRLFRLQRPDVERAFDTMADEVEASSARGAALIGIRPSLVPGLDAVIATARERNVRLIQGASEDFLGQVRQVLEDYQGSHAGKGAGPARLATLLKAPAPGDEPEQPKDLTEALQARVGVSRSRAVLIARDQTLKLNSAITQHRQRAAGITQYKWSTSHDERVRPSHAELDGQVFSWDSPPVVDDEPANPGEPINCRCVPVPYVAELDEPAAAPAPAAQAPDFAAAAEE